MPVKENHLPEQQLIDAAKKVRRVAHARYSGYKVGSALQDEKGQLHSGCNVENAAYPEGTCAETNAIGAMVTAGGQRIVSIAVVGGQGEIESCTPCGGCRQRIFEFSDKNTRVILMNDAGEVQSYSINELLPVSFQAPNRNRRSTNNP